jgi:hypothetical protein
MSMVHKALIVLSLNGRPRGRRLDGHISGERVVVVVTFTTAYADVETARNDQVHSNQPKDDVDCDPQFFHCKKTHPSLVLNVFFLGMMTQMLLRKD